MLRCASSIGVLGLDMAQCILRVGIGCRGRRPAASRGAGRRVAELARPRARGPLFAATQIVEIKTFTLRERYEVLLLRTSCYAGRSAPHSKLCSESFFICHFPLSAR